MRRRIFSNDDDIREQSKRYCFDQILSISRTNQVHRYLNSFHQRESDRRIHRFNLRVYRSNDNWRFDKIINQRQIRSISRRFRDRIAIVSAKRLRDSNLWESINEFSFSLLLLRDSKLWKLNNESVFSVRAESNSHLITSLLSIYLSITVECRFRVHRTTQKEISLSVEQTSKSAI